MDYPTQQPTAQDQQQRAMYAMLLRQQGQQPAAGPGVAGGLTSAANGILQGIAMRGLMRPGLVGQPAKPQPVAPNYAGPDVGMLSTTA